jgi:TPR repeat protein
LLHGHGIEANKGYALTWFDRSAELGEPRAYYALGCMYEEGQGVRIDRNKAVEYFRKGAEQYHDP